MAKLIELPSIEDPRGSLTVIEDALPFEIRRIFFVHHVTAPRGGHRHKTTRMALIALGGKVRIFCQGPEYEKEFWLEKPNQCLLLEPEDWHIMDSFDPEASLVVIASTPYDRNDYIDERYR